MNARRIIQLIADADEALCFAAESALSVNDNNTKSALGFSGVDEEKMQDIADLLCHLGLDVRVIRPAHGSVYLLSMRQVVNHQTQEEQTSPPDSVA